MRRLTVILALMMCFVMTLISEKSNAVPPEFAGQECEKIPIRQTHYGGGGPLGPGSGTLEADVYPIVPNDKLLIIKSINYHLDTTSGMQFHSLRLVANFQDDQRTIIFIDKVPDRPPLGLGRAIQGNTIPVTLMLKSGEILEMILPWKSENGDQYFQEYSVTLTGYIVDATCTDPF